MNEILEASPTSAPLLKLNLGCGFKKKVNFINVDSDPGVQPDVVFDLTQKNWPWPDQSVEEVVFDFSLEEMGESKKDLLFILKELYRVCAPQAKVSILAVDPNHDQFSTNPLCVHKLSPDFFALLSVQNNLNQIANGLSYTCLGMSLGVNFNVTRMKQLLSEKIGREMEVLNIPEIQMRERMYHQRNIVQAFEVDLQKV